MAGITGQGTTFNLPNFVGELFNITPEDTPLLSAIGGLTGGQRTDSKRFEWGFYDLRATADRARVEGANAPTAEERVRSNAFNVVEIHQEAIELSYTKLADAMTDALVRTNQAAQVSNEWDFQVQAALKSIARDVEWSFINQSFNDPADNTTPRRTRGLIQAIATNVTAVAASAALTEAHVLDTIQLAYDNGGLQEGETRTIIVGSAAKRYLTKLFITNKGFAQTTERNVGGVNLQVMETDFGKFNIMLDRHVPAGTMLIVSLEDLNPVILEIPGKGFLFVEPLAKVGASERAQLYGEIGLDYGNERKHAKITGFTTP
jgi:hypothetical protein